MNDLTEGDVDAAPAKVASAYRRLTVEQAARFRALLETFLNYFHGQEKLGRTFDFTDCALGNLLFAGCFLEEACNFNRSIRAFSQFYEVAPDALLNVTCGENLFLVAEKEDGSLLLNEADIVAEQSSAQITELYLLDEDIYKGFVENATEPANGWLPTTW